MLRFGVVSVRHSLSGMVLEQTGSWRLVFAATIVFYVLGWGVFTAWAKGTPQFK